MPLPRWCGRASGRTGRPHRGRGWSYSGLDGARSAQVAPRGARCPIVVEPYRVGRPTTALRWRGWPSGRRCREWGRPHALVHAVGHPAPALGIHLRAGAENLTRGGWLETRWVWRWLGFGSRGHRIKQGWAQMQAWRAAGWIQRRRGWLAEAAVTRWRVLARAVQPLSSPSVVDRSSGGVWSLQG